MATKHSMLNMETVKQNCIDGRSPAEASLNLLRFFDEGLQAKKFGLESISFKQLGIAMGAINPVREHDSISALKNSNVSTESCSVESVLAQESAVGNLTNAFQVLTTELLGRAVIEGYENNIGYIGDRLVTTSTVTVRATKVPGIKTLGGPLEVAEGHPYEEVFTEDKYVVTDETKKGRILSLSEELLIMDQTGEMVRRARMLGMVVRQERERAIVRGVQDADASSGKYVYRPSGSGASLYNTNGANYNYIGVGNTTSTSFNAAVALQDWNSINKAIIYRATEVKDDRVDGTPQPIMGLNSARNILLVPETLMMTANYIATATEVQKNTNTAADETRFANAVASMIGEILHSPFVDQVSVADWYYGYFPGQFLWTEFYPIQTFTQGRDSESAFERDTVFRIKARYYGGLSALDTRWVTKVDGA
jgi:hypothetical protein